jgi:hypothetical protein
MTQRNLVRVKTDPKLAFRVHNVPPKNKIVSYAIKKHCPPEIIEAAINGYRRSDVSVNALVEDFMRCDIEKPPLIWDEHLLAGIERTKQLLLPPYKTRPVHYCDLREFPWTLSTSVEAPYSTDTKKVPLVLKKLFDIKQNSDMRRTFHNLYNYVFVKNRGIVHQIKDHGPQGDKFFYYNTAHARSHLVENQAEDKVRMVHGVPKLLIQVEAMFLYPYFNFLRKQTTAMLWGYETMMGGVYRLYNDVFSADSHFNTFCGFDWKMFDKRVSFELIDIVHQCWFDNLILDQGYIPSVHYTETVSQPERMTNLWNWMTHAVKHTPILLPDGSLWKRRYATLASGMLQTQILDSWVNSIVLNTTFHSLGFDINSMLLKLMGDDSFVATHMVKSYAYDTLLKAVEKEALRRFGFILHPESQCQSTIEGLNILGYSCNHGLPKRDQVSLLAQLLYPEKYPNLSQLRARAVGIAMASCGQDDLVYNVCKDVFEYCTSQGVTESDPSGTHFRNYIKEFFDVDYNVFPDKLWLQSRLLESNVRSLRKNDTFWKKDYFLSEF